MVKFLSRIADLDYIVAAVAVRLDRPTDSEQLVELDKNVPNVAVIYGNRNRFLFVIPIRIKVYGDSVAIVMPKHLPEKVAEVTKVENDIGYVLIGNRRAGFHGLHGEEHPPLQLVYGPVLKREVDCRIEACVLLCSLRLSQGHYVFLALKLHLPVAGEVGSYVAINLYLRGYGFLPHVGKVHRGMRECGILFPVYLREIKLLYSGYQSFS